jgi:Cu/Ag efflux protein CusF
MERTQKPTVAASSLAAVVVFSGALIGTGVVVVSCQRETPVVKAKRPADKVYATRGEIRMLPSPGKATAQLIIHHEPIDDFENPDGTRGMSSMEMPFVAAADVSLSGLNVGDAVEFDLSVWHVPGNKSIESYRVTRMKKLAPGTALKFGAATPTLGITPEKQTH